jgi:hypothetical protein
MMRVTRPYLFAIMLALVLVAVLPTTVYSFAESSYLHGRYARHLLRGEGLVFNSGERVLLTPAILPIMADAALPFNSKTPDAVFPLLLIALSSAALYRHLPNVAPSRRGIAVLLWIAVLWAHLGSIGFWTASLGVLASAATQKGRHALAAIIAGMMCLVSPIALIFAGLLHAHRPRLLLASLVPFIGWGLVTLAYFGPDGLRGLALNPILAPDLSPLATLILLPPLIVGLGRGLPSLPTAWLPLILFSLVHSLLAPGDLPLLILICLLCLFQAEDGLARWQRAVLIACLPLVIEITFAAQPRSDIFQIEGNTAYDTGGFRQAWGIEGTAIGLDGGNHPQHRALVDRDDVAGLLILTAPEVVLSDTLPDDPALAVLDYQPQAAGVFERQTDISDWRAEQGVGWQVSRDLTLTSLTTDRFALDPGGVVRVQANWTLDALPDQPLRVRSDLLAFDNAVIGATEQVFGADGWQAQTITTAHAIAVEADPQPGIVRLQWTLTYRDGTLGQGRVATFKIPMSIQALMDNPLARFSGPDGTVDLIAAQTDREEAGLAVQLQWQARTSFDGEYRVFIHVTALDDAMPLAQADQLPLNGRYPTSIWAVGEVISDRYQLDLAALPTGDYAIRVGLYHPERGRLQTTEGDSFIIETLSVPPG